MVTGAGSGVGRASALALAREGYVLVLVGRRVKALDQTAAEIESGAESGSGKPPTLVVSANVGDPAAVNEVFAKPDIHLTQVTPTSCSWAHSVLASQSATIERYGVGSTAMACCTRR